MEELEEIKACDTEDDLMEILWRISDKVVYKKYSQEQAICIVKELVKINLLLVKYEIREEILDIVTDAVQYYDVKDQIDWQNILTIKDKLEDDLKEYVEEFIV